MAGDEAGNGDGYRWFDIEDGLWKNDPAAKLTLENGKFCVETTHVY